MERRRNIRFWIVIPGILIVLALAWLLVIRIEARHRLTAARTAWNAEVTRLGVTVAPPANIPSPEDAASWIMAAAEIVQPVPYRRVLARTVGTPVARWSADDLRAAERMLAVNAEPLRLLHHAARLPRASFGPSGDADGLQLLRVLWAGRMLAVSARLHLAHREEDKALDDLVTLERMASALEQGRRSIHLLFGIACEGIAGDVIRDAVEAGALSPAGAGRLMSAVPDTDLVRAAQRAGVVETDRMAGMIESQRLDDLLAQGGLFYRTNSELNPGKARLLAWLGMPWRQATLAYLYQRRVRNLEVMATPYVRLAGLKAKPRPSLPAGVWLGSGSDWYWSMAAGRIQGRAAMRRLLRDALAVAVKAGRSGVFPRDLSGIDDGTPELFCECVPSYRVEANGTAIISLAGAAPLWKKAMGKLIEGAPALFTWKISKPRLR